MSDEKRKVMTISAATMAHLELQPGDRFALRYDIKERLHADRSGVLYLAVERATGEEVEIHVLHPGR
ncbi:hypothetical protein FWJ25_13420 [Marinobacter salinexigens]|uniref:Uncharacterized protein n=1 Tax=Marinobacter salinexigens TaxID=2919747 RepID=A0A5B0VDX1_9GAMM|nr:hypothetical protein [Marinobacter salinexigens]KAA1172807.1 hypothetical protein FWJ25_13420 [Marinobacter salinexigens]